MRRTRRPAESGVVVSLVPSLTLESPRSSVFSRTLSVFKFCNNSIYTCVDLETFHDLFLVIEKKKKQEFVDDFETKA